MTSSENLRSGHATAGDNPEWVVPGADGNRAIEVMASATGREQPARWLTVSMVSLGILAAASAGVSYSAQYRMVLAAKAVAPVAAMEAGIPDVAALIFATLGIALALNGKRAIRARFLNIGAVATSVGMNVLASGPGWRNLAIWAMPPVAYALASDTAIGVVRAWTIACQKSMTEPLADAEATPLAVLGGLLLWFLRLSLAPASTLAGFRRWVIEECPIAPGRRVSPEVQRPAAPAKLRQNHPPATSGGLPTADGAKAQTDAVTGTRVGSKTHQFLALVTDRYGPLPQFPLASVSRVCSELAPEVDLDPGAARAALRRHVLAAQNGNPS